MVYEVMGGRVPEAGSGSVQLMFFFAGHVPVCWGRGAAALGMFKPSMTYIMFACMLAQVEVQAYYSLGSGATARFLLLPTHPFGFCPRVWGDHTQKCIPLCA